MILSDVPPESPEAKVPDDTAMTSISSNVTSDSSKAKALDDTVTIKCMTDGSSYKVSKEKLMEKSKYFRALFNHDSKVRLYCSFTAYTADPIARRTALDVLSCMTMTLGSSLALWIPGIHRTIAYFGGPPSRNSALRMKTLGKCGFLEARV